MTNRESEAATHRSSEHQRERELICACTRLRSGADERDRLNDLLRADFDWQYLFTIARRHALVPLLYHQLQECDPGLVPNAYLQKLKTSYQENVARNLVLMDELLSIARDLRARGIDCLPFKGPLLGMAAYGDPALRQSVDLDILVSHSISKRSSLNARLVFAARICLRADPSRARPKSHPPGHDSFIPCFMLQPFSMTEFSEPSGRPEKHVTIFCDGSSLGNGREAARAAAVALLGFKGLWRAFGTYIGNATNQQAEIAAAALGLEALKEPCRVTVHTDSRYVIETMKGSFRRKTNHDWWKRLDEAAARHQIQWQWSQGHAGHVIQEAADRAARKIAALGHVEPAVLQDAVDRVGVIEPEEEEDGRELFEP